MKVEIIIYNGIIYNGFDELDAIAPFEVLQIAAKQGADVQVQLVTLEESQEVVAANGVRLKPSARLGINDRSDVLIVPGGGWVLRTPQGARAEAERGDIPKAIRRLHEAGTVVASVCTGAMLVAAAGLTKGRSAITHHLAVEDLRATGAEIVEARVVDDGSLVTAGGITSGLDLGIWLVERYFGAQAAQAVTKTLEYECRGMVWRRA